jgi:hypothetical protein
MFRWLTSTNHSYDFSALMETFDQRLDEGRLGYGFGALQATRDDDGVIFSLERATTSSHVTTMDPEGYIRHWTR